MEDLVEQLENIPLNGDDLVMMSTKLGNPDVRFVQYRNLEGVQSVEQLFGATANSVYVLFDVKSESGVESVGHWAGVIRNEHGLSYYDPYGLMLSEDLRITGDPPFLEEILSGHKVEMNAFRAQMLRDETNTCGRHVVVRSVFHGLTNAQYHNMVLQPTIRKKLVRDADVFVSLMTGLLDRSDQRVLRQFFTGRAARPAPSVVP